MSIRDMELSDVNSMYKLIMKCVILLPAVILFISGCSGDSPQRVLYDMQKQALMVKKINEQMNIQPDLATAADSTRLKEAHTGILKYYFENKNNPLIKGDSAVLRSMGRLALASQLELARYYGFHRNSDSVLAAYRRIGTEIPAGRDDRAGAAMGLALTYRKLGIFDSTFAIYDRILKSYYPPLDYYERANNDVVAIPVDKIKIAKSIGPKSLLNRFVKEALDYYARLKTDFPKYPQLAATASVHAGRVYALTEQWDKAISELESLKDSTGQVQIPSLVLIANIYNGPKKDLKRAIDIYEQILARKPDSSIIAPTLLRLGTALCEQKKYDEGRKRYVELKNGFPRATPLLARAQLYYAQSFNEQGKWKRAMSELQWLTESYPYTKEAFRAIRMIPEHFAKEGNTELANIWFEKAIQFYKKVIKNKQGQPITIAANSFLADTYRRMKRWHDAIEALDNVYALDPTSRLAAKALYNAASIAYQNLKDSSLAQGYLDRLNREFGTTDSTAIHQDDKNNLNIESLQ